MPPQITCASALYLAKLETRKLHFSLSWTVLHAQCTGVLPSCKKIIAICDVFDSVLR